MVIGLQHLILKENNYNQKNLTISVSTNFISLSESDFSTDSLITFKKKSFDNPISVENITGELGTMLDKNNIKNENFNKIKLIQENKTEVIGKREIPFMDGKGIVIKKDEPKEGTREYYLRKNIGEGDLNPLEEHPLKEFREKNNLEKYKNEFGEIGRASCRERV